MCSCQRLFWENFVSPWFSRAYIYTHIIYIIYYIDLNVQPTKQSNCLYFYSSNIFVFFYVFFFQKDDLTWIAEI